MAENTQQQSGGANDITFQSDSIGWMVGSLTQNQSAHLNIFNGEANNKRLLLIGGGIFAILALAAVVILFKTSKPKA